MDTTDSLRSRLRLVEALPEEQGPISRLGLWNRVQPVSRRGWVWFVATKLLLLASLIYLIYA